MIDIAQMTYSEFCEYLDGDGYDRFEAILSYDTFAVYWDTDTERYYYLEGGENDASDFYEVELAATLRYDADHDIKLPKGEDLHHLFDCCACGEEICNDRINYLWFKKKDKENAP